RTYDIDAHENLSPGKHRAPGHTNTPGAMRVQSHHIIQDEWAQQNVQGYQRGAAAAILLPSSSGQPHALITGEQAVRRNARVAQGQGPFGGPPIREQFQHSYRDMINSGVPQDAARKGIRQAYKYFDSIGAFK